MANPPKSVHRLQAVHRQDVSRNQHTGALPGLRAAREIRRGRRWSSLPILQGINNRETLNNLSFIARTIQVADAETQSRPPSHSSIRNLGGESATLAQLQGLEHTLPAQLLKAYPVHPEAGSKRNPHGGSLSSCLLEKGQKALPLQGGVALPFLPHQRPPTHVDTRVRGLILLLILILPGSWRGSQGVLWGSMMVQGCCVRCIVQSVNFCSTICFTGNKHSHVLCVPIPFYALFYQSFCIQLFVRPQNNKIPSVQTLSTQVHGNVCFHGQRIPMSAYEHPQVTFEEAVGHCFQRRPKKYSRPQASATSFNFRILHPPVQPCSALNALEMVSSCGLRLSFSRSQTYL